VLTLGIETSCDETSAAIYDDKKGILSNVIFSQVDQHKFFGGVVPEIASRSQLEKINPIINAALETAQTTLENLVSIAVTNKPGLPGSLIVGVCFAKSLAWSKEKNLIGVNHLEAHAFSPLIERDIPFPHLCLTASGGHTSLYLLHDWGKLEILGQTQDDAAGETLDKVAKMLGFDYPGGPVIERFAQEIGFKDFFRYPRGKEKTLDFSFSGLKTAVLYSLVKLNAYNMSTKKFLKEQDLVLKQQISSSILVCMTDIFKQKIELAYKLHPYIKAITMAGGVACNQFIRDELNKFCKQHAINFFVPSPQYCTDNAAMIAFVGNYKTKQEKFSNLYLDILD